MVRASFVVFLLMLFAACSSRPAATSVYYWKTTLDWSSTDTARLTGAGVDTVGLRLFDWGVQGREGPLVVRSPLPTTLHVVPVVYVTTARLEAWARQAPGPEAARELLAQMDEALLQAWSGHPAVWQLDADWTASTRAAWFAVAKAFGDLIHQRGARFEVTVRMHQVRDRDTQGVPPADAGVLMLYGAGDDVLDLDLVKAYVRGGYPLPLTVAYPAYTQVRQYNGYGKLVALHRLGRVALPLDALQFKDRDHYVVLRRSSLAGRALLAHDELRVDGVNADTLRAVTELPAVAELRRASGDRVWVFDYDADGWEALVHGPLAPFLFPR